MNLKVRAVVVMLVVLVSATMPPIISGVYCPPPKGKHPTPTPHPHPPKSKPPVSHPPVVKPTPPSGGYPPYTPSPPSGGGSPKTPVTPSPPCGSCSPKTPISPSPPSSSSCPKDALKLGACVDLLGGLINIGVGDPVVNQCCPVLQGLLDLEAALCLCTAIRAKLLNLNVYLPLVLQLLATCGKNPPSGFTCPT